MLSAAAGTAVRVDITKQGRRDGVALACRQAQGIQRAAAEAATDGLQAAAHRLCCWAARRG